MDEFTSCIWVWVEGGAFAVDAMLLGCICDPHELVH